VPVLEQVAHLGDDRVAGGKSRRALPGDLRRFARAAVDELALPCRVIGRLPQLSRGRPAALALDAARVQDGARRRVQPPQRLRDGGGGGRAADVGRPAGEQHRLAVERREREQRSAPSSTRSAGSGAGARGCRSSSACSAPVRRRLRRVLASTRRVTPISQPSSAPRGMSRWRRQAIAYASATASSASSGGATERA
jgi:hypothetical protein